MNSEIKEAWLAKLKSSKYCSGALRQGDCFCVLGCLADVMVERGVGEWTGNIYLFKEDDWYRNILPTEVLEECGIGHDDEKTLWEANDHRGEYPIDLVESL